MTSVYPIVEGHGEVDAVPVLLRRIALELLGLEQFYCFRPHRLPRGKLSKAIDMGRALELGRDKLSEHEGPKQILVLMDADDDCPLTLRAEFFRQHPTLAHDSSINHSVVFAVREYEAWFLAANLTGLNHQYLRQTTPIHPRPEDVADPKKDFTENFLAVGRNYDPRADLVRFTAVMDLNLAQARAPSFDKLVRDLRLGLT
jgi:hypothetical protein